MQSIPFGAYYSSKYYVILPGVVVGSGVGGHDVVVGSKKRTATADTHEYLQSHKYSTIS